ncbi:hypothetical protein EYF80_015049 [Liparis tanakae]|uniref:Uncharacterized protein n=1 Tax=Liparis tanakae TaxID=230148 RepID=A0A4Z2IAE1_9TELE|nr:hypothetical protein EYF80_015049 [Liparis tanakae]
MTEVIGLLQESNPARGIESGPGRLPRPPVIVLLCDHVSVPMTPVSVTPSPSESDPGSSERVPVEEESRLRLMREERGRSSASSWFRSLLPQRAQVLRDGV